MKTKRSKIIFAIIAAVIFIAAAVTAIKAYEPQRFLVLTDVKTKNIYAQFPIAPDEQFSVEFIHSVNKSPVKDIYEIRNGSEIFVVETDYYGFGAGVQTELNPGEILEYGDDGAMQVKNIDQHMPNLIYVVGTVSDHVLCIGNRTVSLRDLCGKSSHVLFTVKNTYF